MLICCALCLLCAACSGAGSSDDTPQSSAPPDIISGEETLPTPPPPPPPEAPELTRAKELLAGMSLEEKAAQMFIARCPEADGAALVTRTQPGGYILFGRDFEGKTAEQVTADIESYQSAAKIPLLIGVDEEGGYVNRVSSNPYLREAPFSFQRLLYNKGGVELLVSDTKEKCELLRSLGINVNFAPVCDISTNSQDYIYDRSMGQSAEITSQCIAAIVAEMNAHSVGSVLKHFPGYGSNGDTHKGIIHDKRALESFQKSDFLPFEAGIKAGAGCVLVSHNIVEDIDKDFPASLSPKAHEILRQMGFDGVIVTDDLSMGAILDYTDAAGAAVAAVEAGNDLLCCTDYEAQLTAVTEAVKSGRITEERIEASVTRILLWKIKLGIV